MSINQLAHALCVPANRLSQIVQGKRSITPDTSLRLARYFGFSQDYWLNLQAHYDLEARAAEAWPPHRGRPMVAIPGGPVWPLLLLAMW
jgi:addiction module HigA family antidote